MFLSGTSTYKNASKQQAAASSGIMDVLGKIVGGSGCAVDGTVAAQNPLSRALDGVLQSQARGAHGRGPGPQMQQQRPGFARDLSAQMQRQQFAQAADAQFLQGLEQQAMQRSQMEAAFRAGEAQQAAMGRPHHAAMEAAFQDARLQQHHPQQQFHGMPRGHGQMAMRQRPQAHEAWVDDFRGASPMDAAWQTAGKTPHEAAWEQARTPAPHMYRPPPQQLAPTVEQPAQAASAARSVEAQQASAEMARTMSQNPDPKWQNSEFLQFMNQVSSGEVELDEEKNQVSAADGLRMEGALEGAWGDAASPEVRGNRDLYESSWKSSADTMESAFADASGASAQAGLDAAWEAESKAAAPVVGNALDGAWGDARTEEEKAMEGAWAGEDNLEQLWEKAMAEAQTTDPFEDAWDNATSSEYAYKAENPFLDASENFQKGVEFFNAGHLDDAILAFEAEVQQHPENSDAWRMLGECHAENDEDKSAIVCLERAVEEDPYNLSALLALGVSNVNELNPQGALKTLKAWVQHNPKFHGLEIRVDEYSDGSLMDEVMQLMLQARAHDPSDSDVQVVLGVLYNVSKDYDAAVSSFKTATSERPDEYALWNKIGATLANSSRSSEAIPSYHRCALAAGVRVDSGVLTRRVCLFVSQRAGAQAPLRPRLAEPGHQPRQPGQLRGGHEVLPAGAEPQQPRRAHLELFKNLLHVHGALRPRQDGRHAGRGRVPRRVQADRPLSGCIWMRECCTDRLGRPRDEEVCVDGNP